MYMTVMTQGGFQIKPSDPIADYFWPPEVFKFKIIQHELTHVKLL